MINIDILEHLKAKPVKQEKVNRKFFTYKDEPANTCQTEDRKGTLDFARSFIHRIIECYWDIICCGKKTGILLREVNFSFKQLSAEKNELAIKIGSFAANMEALESGYYISSIYTKIIPREHRASLGIFYTPTTIVNRLIEDVSANGFDWQKGKILDPACGGGAFMAPLAIKLICESDKKSSSQIIEDIESRLRGYEIDPFAAWMSMVFLDAALLNIYKKTRKKIKNIVGVRNTLVPARENEKLFDLIIGNPPYGKVSLESKLRKFYARSLYGHANQYGLFIDAALRLSKPGALIAFVTSTSYLGGKYFQSLRDLLRRESPPVLMDFIEERKGVFDEVLQETMVTLFKKGSQNKTGISINVVSSNGEESSVAVKHIGKYVLDNREGEPWEIPRDRLHFTLFNKIKKMKNRLEHLGYTVVTGQLVWNRHKDQLSDELKKNSFPLIWAESITRGETFQFSFSKRDHKPYFTIREGQDYLLTKEPCLLVQRTTAKEQKKRIIGALLPESFIQKFNGVVVENHLNIIKKKDNEVRTSLETLKFILNSRTLDMIFRTINGSVAVSAYEIKSLPMPELNQIKLLDEMIKEKIPIERIEDKLCEIYGVRDVVA